MLRSDFIFRQHRRGIVKVGIPETAARLGVQHFGLIRYQLHHIGVAGYNHGIDALRRRLFAQCSEDVIGFEPIQFKNRDVESPYELPYPPELPCQFRRGFRPRRLVIGVHQVPEGWRFSIESDGVIRRFQVVDGLQQNRSETVNRPYRFAGLAHRERRQGVKSPVYQAVTVKEY